MYQPIEFVRNRPENYWEDRSTGVALLRLSVDRREVEHDGYCSDPGDDIGEWVYDQVEIYSLNQVGKDFFIGDVDQYGNVELSKLKDSFESEELGCQCGSNYCGYEGSVIIKSGRLISPEYMINLKDQANLETMAYLLAEKDNFNQNSDYYWNCALDHVRELNLLSIGLVKEMEKTRRREQKLSLLKDSLLAEGMTYRADSKLCWKWISGETDKTLEEVVRTMAECKWCIEYHDLFSKMKEYSKKNPETERHNLFSLIKAEILLEHPLPTVYPWKQETDEENSRSWFW